jgi:hypothetical protein
MRPSTAIFGREGFNPKAIAGVASDNNLLPR